VTQQRPSQHQNHTPLTEAIQNTLYTSLQRSRTQTNCRATTELLARNPIVHQVDVARERMNLDSEAAYWAARIAELNRSHGMG